MADLKRWPYALNQPGYEYPAEMFRAEHHDATSGGNGVGAPTALKVTAQAAPDGTEQILPGGAKGKAAYAGAAVRTSRARNFQPYTLDVPATGSASGGRHDLVILRVCDPQYDVHPDHAGGEITAEEAAQLDFWWLEIHQGKSATTSFDFPFVPLAHIRRGPNQTIVRPEDIIDLRKLANPQTLLHMRANNLVSSDTQSLHTGSKVWPTDATHTVRVPEFATRVHALANWSNILAERTTAVQALVRIFLIHPDGTELSTQESRWRPIAGTGCERFNVVLSDNRPIPEKFRGEDVRVELRGTKLSGPNVYMDGNSSWSLQLYFEQEIV